MDLYIVRHGERPDARLETEFQGTRTDPDLTPRGLEQAAEVAAWLPGTVGAIDHIYSSPMKRAVQTAEPLASNLGKEIALDDRLRDSGGCRADGTPYPADALPSRRRGLNVVTHPYDSIVADDPEGESYMDLRRRAATFLQMMIEEHRDQRVVVFTHSGIINVIIDHIFNVGPHRRVDIYIEQSSISRFQYRYETNLEPWVLRYVGVVPGCE